jgi:hypothetical protein
MMSGGAMLHWFLLAGNDPEKLKIRFISFYDDLNLPFGLALWKWKRTCWICAPDKLKQNILTTFNNYGIIEFSSAPSPSDIEFLHGDANALNRHQPLKPPHT